MFHLDRVNRLPEQTQRRVYGCAAPAQRCGGGGVKIFRWGVSPSKSLNTATTSPTYTFGHSNRQASSSGVLPPSYEYYIHRTAQHLHTYACNPRPERSKGPPFQHYPATWVSSYRDWSPLLNTRASSYTSRIGTRAWVWAPGQKRY